MNRFMLFFFLFSAFALGACQKKSEEKETEVVIQNDGVGPFTVQFDANSNYENKIDVAINQDAGKIEFFIPPGEAGKISIEALTTQVRGCNGNQVISKAWWFADADTTSSLPVTIGSQMTLLANKKALLLLTFQNLTGCTNIGSTLRLKKVAIPAFPPDFLGDWNKRLNLGGGFVTELAMNLKVVSNSVVMTYFSNCGNGSESFTGAIASSTNTTFSARIERVTREFSGACGNVFAVANSDVGRYAICRAERQPIFGTFRLSCKLSSRADDFPQDWVSGDISW